VEKRNKSVEMKDKSVYMGYESLDTMGGSICKGLEFVSAYIIFLQHLKITIIRDKIRPHNIYFFLGFTLGN
jgi:hypothetical protein